MKFLATTLIFLLCITTAAADNIVISQVIYDPVNTDSGGEAVQLYNPTENSIDISGWIIATETSATDATIPESTILSPGSYYLIADTGWSEDKDNPNWPDANHEEALTLSNTDAGVAVINGTTIDAVGWGDASGIESGLYEGTPAAYALEGQALVRDGDTDNNIADFTNASPLFQQSIQSDNEIIINAIITSSAPIIEEISITDDDETSDGIQISPVPGQNKTVNIQATISDTNGYDDITAVVVEVDSTEYALSMVESINPTTATYEGSFEMNCYDAAGTYTIQLTAEDTGSSTSASRQFEYLSLISIELDTGTLAFAATPGSSAEVIGDLNTGTSDSATIHNTGNSVIDITIAGTDLSTESRTIDVSSMQYTFSGTDYTNALAGQLSSAGETKNVNLQPGTLKELTFKLNVPTATMPGNYTGSVLLTAVSP